MKLGLVPGREKQLAIVMPEPAAHSPANFGQWDLLNPNRFGRRERAII
jgi:hypothetical protein